MRRILSSSDHQPTFVKRGVRARARRICAQQARAHACDIINIRRARLHINIAAAALPRCAKRATACAAKVLMRGAATLDGRIISFTALLSQDIRAGHIEYRVYVTARAARIITRISE